MEYVYYQDDIKTKTFSRYHHINHQGIQKIVIHGSLKEVVQSSPKNKEDSTTFLLSDEYFSFFQFDIFRNFSEPFSYQDMNHILQTKKNQIKSEKGKNGAFLFSYIDDIYINGEQKSKIIGKTGTIMFRLYMIYIDDICLNHFKSHYGNNSTNINIFPQSLYSILFIKHKIQRENFILLDITNEYIKSIVIKKGFYTSCSSINLGLQMLKNIYKEHDIIQYRNKAESTINTNSVALNLVNKSLTFYSQMICKRLSEKNMMHTDIFLVSSVLKNGFFIDIFNEIYKKNSSNFIIPFHNSSILRKYGKKRAPDEMNILVYLNKEIFMNNTILSPEYNEEKGNTSKQIKKGFSHHTLKT